MTVEIVDGIRVLKLRDTSGQSGPDSDMVTMLHLWRLLSGGHDLRDNSVVGRRYI